jgi:bifunctional NMN adenylyltransferase/nudix hydrolase
MTDICVFAGRFRPFHSGHLHVIREALLHAQYAFVVIGSIDQPINFRNPFTYEQVREMIRASLTPAENDRVFMIGLHDYDSDLRWVTAVQQAVTKQANELRLGYEPNIALIGHEKDGSSYYLKLFPQWGSIAASPHAELDATTIRDDLYLCEGTESFKVSELLAKGIVPHGTYLFLRQWINTDAFEQMRMESRFMADYLLKFQRNPFTGEEQQFNTADACVIQAGAVLLVRRDKMPGESLWALPGGHKHARETFLSACLRELGEETNLFASVDESTVRLSMRGGGKLLDNPWRSTRMVTVSYAYGFLLPGVTRPVVKGSDDAREARWWNIDEVTRSMMFEDHYSIVEDFSNRFRDITV